LILGNPGKLAAFVSSKFQPPYFGVLPEKFRKHPPHRVFPGNRKKKKHGIQQNEIRFVTSLDLLSGSASPPPDVGEDPIWMFPKIGVPRNG